MIIETKSLIYEKISIILRHILYFMRRWIAYNFESASLPEDVLIVSIKRGDREILPRGDVKLMGGDYLVFVQDANQLDDMNEKICSLTRNEP